VKTGRLKKGHASSDSFATEPKQRQHPVNMRIFPQLSVLLAYLVLAVTAAEQQSNAGAFQKVCDQIATIKNCRTTLSLPSVTVKKGKINWVKWNGCKSRISYGFGWTCLGGWDKGQITGPVGVNVGWQKFAICAMARKAIPNYEDIMNRATGMCNCIPQVSEERRLRITI
jgi:hypothetical protein